jgi:DNA-binding GntR family transcriptional regulator
MSPVIPRILSIRFFTELDALESEAAEMAQEREAAMRRLLASQEAATRSAQASFWEDFLSSDQEYRAVIGRLARFCRANRERRAYFVK